MKIKKTSEKKKKKTLKKNHLKKKKHELFWGKIKQIINFIIKKTHIFSLKKNSFLFKKNI